MLEEQNLLAGLRSGQRDTARETNGRSHVDDAHLWVFMFGSRRCSGDVSSIGRAVDKCSHEMILFHEHIRSGD